MRSSTAFGPGRVWIEVDDCPLEEFQRQRNMEDMVITTSSFIKATPGKPFRVHYNFPSFKYKPFPIEIQLFIDGKLVDTDVSGCDQVRAHVVGEFQGYNVENAKYKSIYQEFKFAQPKITDAIVNEDQDIVLDDYCSIRVVIGWRKISGMVDHRHRVKSRHGNMIAKKVGEDSKLATFGLHSVPGKSFEIESTYICNCHFIKAGDMADHAFVFKYRRLGWLEANKIVSDADPGFEKVEGSKKRITKELFDHDQMRKRLSVTPKEVEVKREPKTKEEFNHDTLWSSSFQDQQGSVIKTSFFDLTQDFVDLSQDIIDLTQDD